jgi:hypothetical protein
MGAFIGYGKVGVWASNAERDTFSIGSPNTGASLATIGGRTADLRDIDGVAFALSLRI